MPQQRSYEVKPLNSDFHLVLVVSDNIVGNNDF